MKKLHLLLALAFALAATAAHAQIPLQQSTASQAVKFGPFVSSTDGATAQTGLTIANTDVKCSKNGGTLASKNSGGGTHDAGGWYTVTLDATDTNTAGRLQCYIQVSGALPVFREFMVYPTTNYAALFSTAPGASGGLFIAGTNAATTVTTSFTSTFTGNLTGSVGLVGSGGISEASYATTAGSLKSLGIVDQGTAQSATGTTLVLRSALSMGDSTANGMTLMACGSTQGYCQSRVVTNYVGSTDTATVDAWTVTPSGTITYLLYATAPSSGGGGGGLDASGVRAAIGMSSANLDTQLAALQSDTDNLQTRVPTSLVSGRMDASVGAYQSGMTPLQPATAGRTLVVDASGLADANTVKVGPTGSGTAQTARDLGGALPTASPGAANGLLIAGSNAATTFTGSNASGATPATAGLTLVGGAASTTSGGVSASGLKSTGGAGAASTNGAAAGATWTGGGTTTVSGGAGVTYTATGTAKDLNATSTPLTLAKSTNITGLNDIAATAIVSSGAITTSGGAVSTVTTTTTATNLTNAPTAGDFTATMKTSIGTAVAASAVASVTAAVTVGTNNDKTGYTLSNTGIDAFADRSTSGHTTGGTWGGAWNAAGANGDPWSTALPGSYTSGTAGYILGNNSGGGPSAATIAAAVWNEALSGHTTSGTSGERLGRIPNAGAGANGGLPTVDASNRIVGIQGTKHTFDDLNDLAAAGIRSSIGLSSANLDTQLGTLATSTNLAALNTKIGTPAGASVSADIAAVKSDTGTNADTAGTTSLLSRLTSARGVYLDNLSAGAVATAASISALNNLSQAQAQTAAAAALAAYDPPTRAEATADANSILASIAALNDISVDQIRDMIVEPNGNRTLGCTLAGILAYTSGDITTSGSTSTYKDEAGTSTRMTITVSSPGNRLTTLTCPAY